MKWTLRHGWLALLFAVCAPWGHAQSCSLCRDTTAGSAPQVRAALRKAIPVLAVPAIALFVGIFVVARRMDAWHREDQPVTSIDIDRKP